MFDALSLAGQTAGVERGTERLIDKADSLYELLNRNVAKKIVCYIVDYRKRLRKLLRHHGVN